jgi:hypothetical protein
MAIEHEVLVQRIFEEGLNGRDYAVWDEVFAADFVAHSALLGEMHVNTNDPPIPGRRRTHSYQCRDTSRSRLP